jgi:hypothetical protein
LALRETLGLGTRLLQLMARQLDETLAALPRAAAVRVSRQRRFLPGAGRRAAGYGCTADVFREHAALSGLENDGARAFDLVGSRTSATRRSIRSSRCCGRCRVASEPRLFASGGFSHPTGAGCSCP